MVKYYLFIVIIFQLLVGCSNNSKLKPPKNKIEQSKFVKLLIDVNLLEGHLTSLNVNMPNIRDTSLGQYKGIFEKYNIDYQQYKENYDYYIQHDNYLTIQQEVYDSLEVMEKRYEKIASYKNISFSQYQQILKKDSLDLFLKNDTILTHTQKVDTILHFYRKHQERLNEISIDSISFEKNMQKLYKSKALFNSIMSKVYK